MAKTEVEYSGNKYELSYLIANPKNDKSMLILHGWGSSKDIMKQAFSNYLNDYQHIYLDMPGFGNSPNNIALTTNDYAEIVKLFLKKINCEPIAILGHSFGGKVATLINPTNLILVASAGIIVPKPFSVKVKIATTKFFNKIGLKSLKSIFVASDAKGMNAGMYETFKNVVSEDFEHNFTKIDGNTLLFWGKEDTATPLWTAKKIENIIQGSKLYEYSGDHFFFLNHSKTICDTINKNIS